MPTRRGWGLAIGALLALAAGRLFGILELYILSATAVALLAAAIVAVRLAAPRIEATRTLHPPRVPAGAAARVDLAVRNLGARPTPVLAVRDPFDRGWRWARFLVAPLRSGATARAAYRLPTGERGIYDIGPLEVAATDPFELATRTTVVAGVTQLTVFPHIDRIRPVPATLGTDPYAGADHPATLSGAGEDFYALRPYVVGDDLRRVHWPSTARSGELMIRQDEMPWQTRTTILLDVRHAVHTDASLELAVSAAASLFESARRHRSLVRVVSTDGTDSGFAAGAAHGDAILEHLATLGPSGGDRFASVASLLRKAGNGGSLVVVTTADASSADLEKVSSLRGRYGAVWIVLFERSASDPSPSTRRLPPRPVPAGNRVVRVDADSPFPQAWERAVASEGARAR